MIQNDAFCPAKWQEVVVNIPQNYIFACCKSSPIIFDKTTKIEQVFLKLDEQKNNLLNGIKDSSCNYCWNGNEELRRIKLDHWDNTFNVRSLELNIGNTCNLTCVYCGPKYSSKWAKDLKDGEYPIFTDNEQYKNAGITQSMYNVDDLVKLYNLINPTEQLKFVGGEPIITPLVHDVLDKINISEKEIHFPTSLIYEQSIICFWYSA